MKKRSNFLKIVVCLLLVTLAALFISACGKDETKKDGPKTDIDYLDDLPDDLDFGGEVVNIAHWDHTFVTNELTADGSTADIVDVAIYNRNLSVEERLNVELNYIAGDVAPEVFMPQVLESIMSGASEFDIIWGVQCTSGEVAAEGVYLDLQDAKYIDYSKDYWNDEYIQALSVNDKKFMLGGDISLTTTAWSATMTFDLKEFENNFGDVQEFYDMVLSGDGNKGGWTLDTMSDYCRRAYVDLNGNALIDNGDQFGIAILGTGSVVDQFTFSAGITYSSRDENNVPVLDMNNERVVDFVQKFHKICYENPGVNLYDSGGNEEDMFKTIFSAGVMNNLVDMRADEDDFGVIPLPKYDENELKYHSWLSDNTIVCSMPITTPEDRIDMNCAVLECMASEGKRLLLPAYYESALKKKYTRDEMSVKMLDIIHDGATTDFVAVYSQSLAGIGGCMRQLIGYDEPNFVSWYTMREKQVLSEMAELFKAFEENTNGEFVPETTQPPSDEEVESDTIADNQISTHWEVFATKYRKSQIAFKQDMSEHFAFVINDDDEIEVRSPTIKVAPGYFPTAAIQTRAKIPIENLSCEFKVDDGFLFAHEEGSYGASFSVGWTTEPIQRIPEYLDAVGTNGLRACIPTGVGAYSLVISFLGGSGATDTSWLYIIMCDGTDPSVEPDNRLGLRWSNQLPFELGEICKVEIKEDDELGLVVCINDQEIRTGMRMEEELPIDLTPLLGHTDGGHFFIGGEAPGKDCYSNFTLSTLNDEPVATYFD